MGLIVFLVLAFTVLKFGLPILNKVLEKKADEAAEQAAQARANLRRTEAVVENQRKFLEYLRTCSWNGQIAPWNTTYVEEKLIGLGLSEFNARQKVNGYVEQLGLKIEQLDMSYNIPRNQNDFARMAAMRKIYKSMREKGLPIEFVQRVYHYNFPEVPKDDIMVRLVGMAALDDMDESETSGKTDTLNSADARFSNPAFCAELAERIVEHTNPLIAYIKKTYPDYSDSFFSFYPLAFLIDVLDKFSLEFKLMYAFNVSKEIYNRVDYFTCMKPEYTVNNCPLIKQIWEGLLENYHQNVESYGKEKASTMVFVRLISSSIGKRSKTIDENMLTLTGVGLRDLNNEAEDLWNKYA